MSQQTFSEIVQFAIEREEDAIDAYGDLAQKAKTPGLRELLLDLQKEEVGHKALLTGITKQKIESLEIEDVIDLKISDYMVPEPPAGDMSLQDLLIFAAKKEQKAVALYSSMASRMQSLELKKLFEFLVEQEKAHKLKLETEYEKKVLWED